MFQGLELAGVGFFAVSGLADAVFRSACGVSPAGTAFSATTGAGSPTRTCDGAGAFDLACVVLYSVSSPLVSKWKIVESTSTFALPVSAPARDTTAIGSARLSAY